MTEQQTFHHERQCRAQVQCTLDALLQGSQGISTDAAYPVVYLANSTNRVRAWDSLAVPPTAGQLTPVSEGFVEDPWLSIMLTLCHILHSVSHWPVLVYFINSLAARRGVPGHMVDPLPTLKYQHACHSN
jgi:hypothetical protein